MAKAKSKMKTVAHGIKNIGTVAIIDNTPHSVDILTHTSSPILSNPLEDIDALTKCNPFWGSVALRVLCAGIGYYAVNTVLWEYRKRNMEPKTVSGIDWLNDKLAEKHDSEEGERVREEQGHSNLPFVNGRELIGGYKYLFTLVSAGDDIRSMDVPSPAVLFQRMQDRSQARGDILAAYETFELERFKDSPNFAYIQARMERNKKTQDQRAVNKAQDELDHIHEEMRDIPIEMFSDMVWMRLPLWAQFKFVRSVHKQVISAIANEHEKPADERVHLDALHELAANVLLELEAADREPEVRLAFDRKVLNEERHALIHTK